MDPGFTNSRDWCVASGCFGVVLQILIVGILIGAGLTSLHQKD